jgi:hypothetical protein
MKMMEWPIVLTCSLQYWRRTGEWSAILPFYSLDRVRDSEVADSQPEKGGSRFARPPTHAMRLHEWAAGV